MTGNLSQTAIDFAIKGDWEKAIETNSQILKEDPKDTDALNRMAKAYSEVGDVSQAKKATEKVLKIDPFNAIALRSRNKWKCLSNTDQKGSKQVSADMFLEEPGKTKTVHLIHPCDKNIIAKINCGDIVHANSKGHRISLSNESGNYIGKLPDDISAKIRSHERLGYEYVYAIKAIEGNEIKVFTREIKRPEKYKNQSSFSPDMVDYTAYTPPELIHDKPEIVLPYYEGDGDRDASVTPPQTEISEENG